MRVKLDNLRLLNYYIYIWIVTRATLRVPPIEQELLALQEHMFVINKWTFLINLEIKTIIAQYHILT
jgi:hypothetical protein